MFRFLHAADFHLDSAFAALPPRQAAARRREGRELPFRLADWANAHDIRLVLLSGDLLDSGSCYRETREALRDALGRISAPVFLAPGNHDWYGPNSPYAAPDWPENVHIFRTSSIESVEVPALNAVVHGAAFTGPEQAAGLLRGFHAPEDGRVHLMVLHGELNAPVPRYDPVAEAEIAESGLSYLALGHIHRRSEPLRCGPALAAWPGCPEGRGFDELGEKGFYAGECGEDGRISLTFVPFARHRYELARVDITGREPARAVIAALPDDTSADLYRVTLTGETDGGGVDLSALTAALADRFYKLELRDETRVREDVWARAEEDSLRGLFLRGLREKLDAAATEEEQKRVRQAVRFGLAALDHRDLN